MSRAALCLVAIAGCAGAEAMTLPQKVPAAAPAAGSTELGLTPGESMAFDVKLDGVLAGDAQLAVGQVGEYEGHRAVIVRSRAETAGAAALLAKVVDEATTVIDMDSGRPLKLDTYVVLRGQTTTAQATFDGRLASVAYHHPNDPHPHVFHLDFGALTVYDTHSAMAQLRGWRARPGAARTVFVVGGRRLWRVDLHYMGSETIGSVLGNRRAVRFDGVSYRARSDFAIESKQPARTFSVWLSDDADRVPLKMVAKTELGDVTMDLTSYDRP